MAHAPVLQVLATAGWRGLVRTWLQTWSRVSRPSTDERLTDEPATVAELPLSSGDGSAHVLVVDDEPVNRMLIAAMLRSRGLAPVLAADGVQAVKLVREQRFDLVLMDLQMPVLGGLAATAAVRRLERALSRPAVPIVAFSSTSPDAGVLAVHGFSGSLSKPCDDAALDACLARWCPTYRRAPTGRAGAARS